jgi:hypothetical protein
MADSTVSDPAVGTAVIKEIQAPPTAGIGHSICCEDNGIAFRPFSQERSIYVKWNGQVKHESRTGLKAQAVAGVDGNRANDMKYSGAECAAEGPGKLSEARTGTGK